MLQFILRPNFARYKLKDSVIDFHEPEFIQDFLTFKI